MQKGQGILNKMDGICYKNVLATYTHIHALGTQEWVDGISDGAVPSKKKIYSQINFFYLTALMSLYYFV